MQKGIATIYSHFTRTANTRPLGARPAWSDRGLQPLTHVRRTAEERRAFVLEQTLLMPVPLVPELSVYTAPAVNRVWFETARWLDDDNASVPFWCVPWAGGQALARYLLDHPDMVRGANVLDFACGGGVVAIAAARAGARVSAVDIDPLACVATKLAAEASGVVIDARASDVVDDPLPGVDIVLAGDVWYEPVPSARFRRWFERLTRRGLTVLTSDAGRGYAPRRVCELAKYDVPTPFDIESTGVRPTRVLAIEHAGPPTACRPPRRR